MNSTPTFDILNFATSLRARERIDRTSERVSNLGMGGVFVRNTGSKWEHVSRGRPRAGIKPLSEDFGTLPSRLKELISHIAHVRGQGSEEPKSPLLLKFVVRKCPNKHVHGPVKGLTNACRTSSRWHTRASAQGGDLRSGEGRSQKA